jgi:hypothetical protein
MKIYKIIIPSETNKKVPYLYNKSLEIMNRAKVGGTFHTKYITFDRLPENEVKLLKEYGVIFSKSEIKE